MQIFSNYYTLHKYIYLLPCFAENLDCNDKVIVFIGIVQIID